MKNKVSKIVTLVAAAAMTVGMLAGCGQSAAAPAADAAAEAPAATEAPAAEATEAPALKVGVILVGDENEGYTYAHIEGIKGAIAALGISEDRSSGSILFRKTKPAMIPQLTLSNRDAPTSSPTAMVISRICSRRHPRTRTLRLFL